LGNYAKSYSRQAYNFVDFVGDLGGVFEIFLGLAGLICLPISHFDFNLKMASEFYKVKTKDESLFNKDQSE